MSKCIRILAALLIAAATAAAFVPSVYAAQPSEATLEGRAVLAADTFAAGPSSGNDLTDETKGGREPPFEGQPVGGVSAVLDAGGGEYLAMTDNGFGKKATRPTSCCASTAYARTSRPGKSPSVSSCSCATRSAGSRSRSSTTILTTGC